MSVIPYQSATRMMVPRFPGSWMVSRARTRADEAQPGSRVRCGMS